MSKRSDSQKAIQVQLLKKLMSENKQLKTQAQKKDAIIIELLEKRINTDVMTTKSGQTSRRESKDGRQHIRIKTLIDLLPDGF